MWKYDANGKRFWHWVFQARVIRIVDGDTAVMTADEGFYNTYTHAFRFLGINAPEVVGAQKAEGLRWKAALERLLPVGSEVVIETAKADSFGRWLATVTFPGGQVLTHDMIRAEAERL